MKAHKCKFVALTTLNWIANRWTTYNETTVFDAGEGFKSLDFVDEGGFLEGSGGRRNLKRTVNYKLQANYLTDST